MIFWYIILFSILGSIGAVSAAAIFTKFNDNRQKKLISSLISFAIGTLLTSALIGLIPEALHGVEHDNENSVMITVLFGIIFLFFLEKIIIWRKCQDSECEIHGHEAAGPIVLIGDAFHNFTDGLMIAAAFLINLNTGFLTGLAVILHEIPQETGDFGILLHSGYSRKRAFLYNILSGSTTIPAAIVGFYIFDSFTFITPYMLAFSAASFLYIALSDLTPELHKKWGLKHTISQLSLIILGFIMMYSITFILPHTH
ncbi:MAG: ZIP family metal transporter [Candidatus Lokiarchaeota archaeon]|nr:ZIP family metal transporter [Candidatus Lokiarchaeota archaeon]